VAAEGVGGIPIEEFVGGVVINGGREVNEAEGSAEGGVEYGIPIRAESGKDIVEGGADVGIAVMEVWGAGGDFVILDVERIRSRGLCG
jgi:hypothetical protein